MSKLHLVFGGRVSDPRTLDFNDLSKIEFVIILAGLAEFREDIVAQTEAVLRQGDSTNKPTNVTVKVLDANSTLARWNIWYV